MKPYRRIGILKQTGPVLGGAELVEAYMARTLARVGRVELLLQDDDPPVRRFESYFDLDLEGVGERRPGHDLRPALPSLRNVPAHLVGMTLGDRRLTGRYDLLVCSTPYVPPVSYAGRSVVYCHFPFDVTPQQRLRERAEDRQPALGRARAWLYGRLWDWRLDSFDSILTNSSYSRDWIRRRWEREARVLHPPVPGDPPVSEEDRLIVALGRFSPEKRQQDLIEAFRRFREGTSEEWRLVLIGSYTGKVKGQREFYESLERRARDLPVTFLRNLSRSEVWATLARAKMYWHAMGFGSDPSPRMSEHFGISTVEAMRARCVPLVPAVGGQTEIVTHGIDGLTCEGVDALVEGALLLAGHEERRREMAGRAYERSREFLPDRFDARFRELVLQEG